jgi:RNA polymerase sigma-70 factor (ECF subfamily)
VPSRARFDRVIAPLYDKLVKYAVRMERDHYALEDLIQDAMLKGFEKLDQLTHDDKAEQWMRTIIHRLLVDKLSKPKLEIVHMDLEEVDDDMSEHFYEDTVDEGIEAMWETALQLSAKDRSILSARIVFGFSFDEIGWNLGVTPVTARKRYERAAVRLRELCNE